MITARQPARPLKLQHWNAAPVAEPPNPRLVLTNPDAAQRVPRPRCSLSRFAAQPHVRLA